MEYSDFRSHITAFNEMEAQKKAKHMERVEKRKQKKGVDAQIVKSLERANIETIKFVSDLV